MPDLQSYHSEFFGNLNKIENYFDQVINNLPQLSDEQLKLLYEYFTSIGQSSWRVQCAIIAEAQSRKKFGEGTVEAIAKEFGIGRAQAFRDARIYKTFLAEGDQYSLESKTYFSLALDAEDPKAAIEYADSKKQEGYFSTREFKRYLKSIRKDDGPPKDEMNYFVFPIYRDAAYLDFIRSMPCCVTREPAEPHHIEAGGVGTKCSDYLTIPLSHHVHREITAIGGGKDILPNKYNIDPYQVALRCLIEYVNKLK